MKKKILSGLFASALLIAAAIGAMESKKSEAGLSDLAMANLEALATGEDGGFYSCTRYCYEEAGWDCKIYANGVLMNTCYGYRKKV